MSSASPNNGEGKTTVSFKRTVPSTRALASRLAKTTRASVASLTVLAKASFKKASSPASAAFDTFGIPSLTRSAASLTRAFAALSSASTSSSAWEGARDRYNRTRRRMGDSVPERGSFHKGLVLLCRDKYDQSLACMQTVDNTDKSGRQRYPATYFVYDLHLSGCQKEFDGGQLKDSMMIRYAMRSGCGYLAPCHHLRGWKPNNRNHHGVAEAHVVGR